MGCDFYIIDPHEPVYVNWTCYVCGKRVDPMRPQEHSPCAAGWTNGLPVIDDTENIVPR